MKTIYIAMRNSDMTEGRGPMVAIAAFENRPDAVMAAKGWGVMGIGDGTVEELRVYSSFNDWEKGEAKWMRKRALDKLSEQDKRVLGL